MENIQELNVGNVFIKNIYFGFENMLPTKTKNRKKEIIETKTEKVKKKSKKKKRSKSKSKSKEKLKQKNNVEKNDSNALIIKPIKNNEEEKSINNKKKSKKNSKQKKKKEITNIKEGDNNNIENEGEEKKDKSKSKSKKKKKSKEKEKKTKKKKKNKSRSRKKDVKSKGEQTMIKDISDDIYDGIENASPQYNEIKDDAMNEVDKHIHDLSLTFMRSKIIKKENNLSKTKLKMKKDTKRKSDSKINTKNKTNKEINLLFTGDETINKRPYTAHGYKVKSKTKKLPKIVKNNQNQEEEKIIAFKEHVYVHDKILSLFHQNFKFDDSINEKNQFSKTAKPKRISSALTKNTFPHYMMPKKKDILKLEKINKKDIEYNNDKYEEDPEEIKKDEKEENLIKNKNDKAIYLIKSSNKIYNKSQQSINDIKHILNKKNIDVFMNNFLIKHNFTTKKEESKLNNYHDIPIIKYYHGGKKIFKPKKNIYNNENNHNKSDNDLLKQKKDKRYKLFNPKEIISNPNNKFNFFNQTFTKEPIYGKYFEPPEIEKSINNNLGTIPSNKFNPRYKLKKFVHKEKENPNDVYNYDYKYDDLNSDSDNELPNTDFKAKTAPKFKKIKYDYRNYKTGKLIKENDENKEILKNDANDLDKKIYHPFLINEDIVNI